MCVWRGGHSYVLIDPISRAQQVRKHLRLIQVNVAMTRCPIFFAFFVLATDFPRPRGSCI